MQWKNYQLQQCPRCGSESYRDGHTAKHIQKFICLNAACIPRRFDERDVEAARLRRAMPAANS